jgi:hypothetical protein
VDSTKPASRSTRRCFDTVGCGRRSCRSISPTDCFDETRRLRIARRFGSAMISKTDSTLQYTWWSIYVSRHTVFVCPVLSNSLTLFAEHEGLGGDLDCCSRFSPFQLSGRLEFGRFQSVVRSGQNSLEAQGLPSVYPGSRVWTFTKGHVGKFSPRSRRGTVPPGQILRDDALCALHRLPACVRIVERRFPGYTGCLLRAGLSFLTLHQ